MNQPENYDWDWRETPEWREVERAISNLLTLDPDGTAHMVTDFVLVAASIPADLSGSDLVGSSTVFCSSKHPYIAKGLLVEGMDIQRELEGTE